MAKRPQNALLNVRFVSEDGTTVLSLLSVQPAMVSVGEGTADIVLSGGLGRLLLDTQDLSGHSRQTDDSWQLSFGRLRVTIQFTGAS